MTPLRPAGIFVLCAAMCCITVAAHASSVTYSFANISNSMPGAEDYSVTVTTQSLGFGDLTFQSQVAFIVRNDSDAAIGSSVKGVYFQNGTLMNVATDGSGNAKLAGSGNVAFSLDATPNHLPGGEAYGFNNPAQGGATFSADADQPGTGPQSTGVKSGDYVEFVFDLKPGKTFADVITALQLGFDDPFHSDALRIGLHVQDFDGANSASLVIIPLPAPLLMGLAGLLGVVGITGFRRRGCSNTV